MGVLSLDAFIVNDTSPFVKKLIIVPMKKRLVNLVGKYIATKLSQYKHFNIPNRNRTLALKNPLFTFSNKYAEPYLVF